MIQLMNIKTAFGNFKLYYISHVLGLFFSLYIAWQLILFPNTCLLNFLNPFEFLQGQFKKYKRNKKSKKRIRKVRKVKNETKTKTVKNKL